MTNVPLDPVGAVVNLRSRGEGRIVKIGVQNFLDIWGKICYTMRIINYAKL